MRFEKLTPMLYSEALEQTVEFYTTILGFECSGLEIEEGWAAVNKDQVEIMISLPNQHLSFEKPSFTGSFYIRTDEVDKLWTDVKDKARICYPLESFEYGMKEFAIYDNNGYMIQFGEEIK